MKPQNKFSSGQIAVVFTLALATLLGSMALGVDVAVLYYNWVQLQKAADSAVLSGALYLTGDSSGDTATENAVTQVVEQNGVVSGEISSGPTVGANHYTVSVQLQRTVPYFFGRVLGLTNGLVTVSSAAQLMRNQGVVGALPIGLECPASTFTSDGTCNGAYNTGQPYSLTFKGSTSTSPYSPGNWGALALGQGGTSTFKSNVTYGYGSVIDQNGMLSVNTQTGNGAPNSFNTAFQARLSCGSWDCAQTAPPPDVNSPQVVEVPVVDFNNQNGKSQLAILGFDRMMVVPPSVCTAAGATNVQVCAYFLGAAADPSTAVTNQTCTQMSTVNACTPVLIE